MRWSEKNKAEEEKIIAVKNGPVIKDLPGKQN